MSDELLDKPAARSVDDTLLAAHERVAALLRQHKLVAGFAKSFSDEDDLALESPVVKRTLDALRTTLDQLHPADVAYILEASPLDERLFIWDLVKADRDGEILIETTDAVRLTLIADMETQELVAAAATLDADELADLAPDLPKGVIAEVSRSLSLEDREQLRAAMSYEEGAVGALMDFEMITVRHDVTVGVVFRYLRRLEELPDHTDQLFVVDRQERLLGVLSVNTLLIADDEKLVQDVMTDPPIKLEPHEKAEHAASVFERYDLISAPVMSETKQLVGRVTVAAVLDFIRAAGDQGLRQQVGLKGDEDVFASAWDSFKNRWAWLALNLVTAFVASQVTNVFQGSIQQLVVLAVVMTIVAGLGGNSGNQTLTMIARGIALGQVGPQDSKRLVMKELQLAGINGLLFGGVMGLAFGLLNKSWGLGVVITSAVSLNLMLAALMGVLIPMFQLKRGGDPAKGSSVMLTFFTDTGGFLIFLGLATLFLLRKGSGVA
jgi:magnesium transporter